MATELNDDPVHAAIPDRGTDTTSLDRSEENATQSLYQAALGSHQSAYYGTVFARFDAADRVGISWNWAAALLTLNWMAYRQLWGAALAYVGALVSAVLLLFGIGRLVYVIGPETELALLLALLTLSVVLPGMFGNALLYTQSRKRMERALASHTTLPEACAMLSKQASGRRRLIWLGLANLALVTLVAATTLVLPDWTALPLHSEKMALAREHQVATPLLASLSAASAQGSVTNAGTVAASASVPNPAPSSAAMPAASTTSAASTASAAPFALTASAPQPAASRPASSSSTVGTAAPSTAAASAARPAASAMALAPLSYAAQGGQGLRGVDGVSGSRSVSGKIQNSLIPALPRLSAPPDQLPRNAPGKAKAAAPSDNTSAAAHPAATTASSAKVAHLGAASAQPVKAAKAAKTPKPGKAASPVASSSGVFMINVGLFAQDNNALNAFTKLKDAGLPALTQVLNSAKGKRTRVRVGPFDTQTEADAAAEKIHALQLDAVVFQQ